MITETLYNDIRAIENKYLETQDNTQLNYIDNSDSKLQSNTLSNLILVQGPRKSGKSSFLRGDANFNEINSNQRNKEFKEYKEFKDSKGLNCIESPDSTLSGFSEFGALNNANTAITSPANQIPMTMQSYKGLILPLLKQTYTKLLTLLKNKLDLLILKAGCFAMQKDSLINVNKCKDRKYFDELLIFPNENMFYVQHLSNFSDIETYIEQSLRNREKVLNINSDYILIFEFLFEIIS